VKYKAAGPLPVELDGGVFVYRGTSVELTASQSKLPHYAQLIEEGKLKPVRTKYRATKTEEVEA